MTDHDVLVAAVRRARELASPGRRRLLGIAGPPGGGKSTLARLLTEELAATSRCVPMDGFHLANAELERLGRRDRKGAPDTFDAAGYVAMLRRLRAAEETVYAPAFHRDLDEAVAGAVAVPPEVPLVITEGNYLLLEDEPWTEVRRLVDEIWYVEVDEQTRLERLVQRHVTFGMTPAAAGAWALGSDQRNADLVARTRDRADLVIHLPSAGPHPHRPTPETTREPPGEPHPQPRSTRCATADRSGPAGSPPWPSP